MAIPTCQCSSISTSTGVKRQDNPICPVHHPVDQRQQAADLPVGKVELRPRDPLPPVGEDILSASQQLRTPGEKRRAVQEVLDALKQLRADADRVEHLVRTLIREK